jgi:hypothetical protein
MRLVWTLRASFPLAEPYRALSIFQSLDNAYRHTYSPSSGYELFVARRVS